MAEQAEGSESWLSLPSERKTHEAGGRLFLRLFVLGVCLAPFAIFLEFYLARDEFAVLARPIVDAVAFRAGEFEKLILRHARHYTGNRPFLQPSVERGLTLVSRSRSTCPICCPSASV